MSIQKGHFEIQERSDHIRIDEFSHADMNFIAATWLLMGFGIRRVGGQRRLEC